MPRTPFGTLVPTRPFGIPGFATFHNALEVSAANNIAALDRGESCCPPLIFVHGPKKM
ncbi:hypothetical protein Q9233_008675 [Columba guinea]|nr:hypothetical protein Q9233_008675 [Columba guinea]